MSTTSTPASAARPPPWRTSCPNRSLLNRRGWTSTSPPPRTTATSGWRRCARVRGRCVPVLSPVQYPPKTAFPADFPLAEEIAAGPDELAAGGEPDRGPCGEPAGGRVGRGGDPLRPTLGAIIAARRVLDTGGHYRRPDLVLPGASPGDLGGRRGRGARAPAQGVPARIRLHHDAAAGTRLRSAPQVGQSPAQPSRHRIVAGTASAIASRAQPATSSWGPPRRPSRGPRRTARRPAGPRRRTRRSRPRGARAPPRGSASTGPRGPPRSAGAGGRPTATARRAARPRARGLDAVPSPPSRSATCGTRTASRASEPGARSRARRSIVDGPRHPSTGRAPGAPRPAPAPARRTAPGVAPGPR